MRTIQKIGFLSLLCVFILWFSGFGSVTAEERTEIRVGAINSLTGSNAMTGLEHRWGYEQAVADINAKGGVYVKELGKRLPINLIFADDKSVPDQAAAAMERLIKLDKIDFALSSNFLSLNVAAGTVCEKYKKYFQIVVSWIDFIEKEHFQYASDMFASTASASEMPFLIWESLPEDQRPKRPALLMEDNQDGQGFGMGFKQWAKKYGYKFVIDDPFSVGTKDFSSQILKYKYAKVDAVITLISPTDGITFLRQLHDMGVKIPYLQGYKGFWTREFEGGIGKMANYVIHDGFWSEKLGAPGAVELQERFKKHFHRDSVSVGLSYANPQILAMAIERAGSLSSEKVRDEVFGGEFKGTMMGDVKYNEKGIAQTPLLGLQWWNGERMPVYPAAPKVWKIKLNR